MIGRSFKHYKIVEQIGIGGMGVVYKAIDLKLDRDVAIKFLPPHIAEKPAGLERFQIEAKAAAALNHPNIATIHAIEEADDQLFIVMELIEGEELSSVIRNRGGLLAMDEIIAYALQIAHGLRAAHRKEIIHRDIKGSNIMVTRNGRVKIMDFGLAKFTDRTELTREGTTLGTVAYMSPEQARGEHLNRQTDIWSFGVMLYEMLTGELPFKGEYDQAVIYSILNENPAPISEKRKDLPESIRTIVREIRIALSLEDENRLRYAGHVNPKSLDA